MPRFSGKRVLITGGTSGIGFVGAKTIAAEGGEVGVTGQTQAHLERGRQRPALQLPDPAQRCGRSRGGRRARHRSEPVGQARRVLAQRRDSPRLSQIDEIDAAFFDRLMSARLRGPILQMAELTDTLNPGASVVLTSSTSAYEGAAMASVYAATKVRWCRSARCWTSTLATRHIRVNVLVPGPIDTNFRHFMSDDFREQFDSDVVGRVPLGRIGTPREAAAVALFLLWDDGLRHREPIRRRWRFDPAVTRRRALPKVARRTC